MNINNKGFSLIELLAVLVLSSVVLVPLTISFTNSITINRRAMTNRVALSVAEGSLYAFEKIDFQEYRNALDDENTALNYYLELNVDVCDVEFVDPNDQAICSSIFNMTSANLTFDATTYKVFLFDYSLSSGEHSQLIADESIPLSVRNELAQNTDILNVRDNPSDNQDIIWIIIWMDYYDDPDQYLVAAGVLANDDTSATP